VAGGRVQINHGRCDRLLGQIRCDGLCGGSFVHAVLNGLLGWTHREVRAKEDQPQQLQRKNVNVLLGFILV
jgi:hypothetical protein